MISAETDPTLSPGERPLHTLEGGFSPPPAAAAATLAPAHGEPPAAPVLGDQSLY